MPHKPAGATQTPAEGTGGVMRPLLTPEAVCGVLGVQRNALARYRAGGRRGPQARRRRDGRGDWHITPAAVERYRAASLGQPGRKSK